jgi:RNA-directed DNA polymerase
MLPSKQGSSFKKLVSIENIVKAYQQASKSKNFNKTILFFERDLGLNLNKIRRSLISGTYRHGKYRFFKVFDQKERQISAASFKDRIVHHAVYQIIEPTFDKTFIHDSFANRTQKGSHKGVKRLQYFIKKIGSEKKGATTYCLKCDISKCFPSLNHKVLFDLIKKQIKNKKILHLINKIISSFQTGDELNYLFPLDSPFLLYRPRGIPIGNLTSQLFVNIYLDSLDKFIKERLRIKYYIRYVDDFVILDSDKKFLHKTRDTIRQFLRSKLFLELHPKKQSIFPTWKGIDFLGYVIFPNFYLLRKGNKQNFKKRLSKMKVAYLAGKIGKDSVQESITSWIAHAQHANTYHLRKRIFGRALLAKDQEKISQFIDSWKEKKPDHKPSGQLHLF